MVAYNTFNSFRCFWGLAKYYDSIKKDVDIFNGFILQSDLGYVDGELQLDKIKGFEIAISYYLEEEPIDIPTVTGSLLLDNLQIWGSYDIYSVDVKTGIVKQITMITDADGYNPSFSNNGKQSAHGCTWWNIPTRIFNLYN